MKRLTLTVAGEISQGQRIDKYLSDTAGLFTRSQLKNLVEEVRMNGREVKLSKRVESGALLEVSYREPKPPSYEPEELDLAVLFENDRVLVLDKPMGMVVHPGSGVGSGTLAQGLLHRIRGLEEAFNGENVRPGIVHRLDKDTSGVIITAKDPEAHEYLSRQFRRRTTKKMYLAVVKGRLRPASGTVSGFIGRDPGHRKRFAVSLSGGKPAVTEYRVLKEFGTYAFVLLSPKTGRTHQLRVHMRSLGAPILGDPLYGKSDETFPGTGLMLHAFQLSIVLPGEEEARVFRAPLPERFKDTLRKLAQF